MQLILATNWLNFLGMHRTVFLVTAIAAGTLLAACSEQDPADAAPGSGGATATGGLGSGGVHTGGAASGGTTGGASTGGSAVASGGDASGGAMETGGSSTGGAATGGGSSMLDNGLPALLSETGLYQEDMQTLAEGVRLFEPRFPLWTDGAEKRRWVLLPADSQIDTTDANYWEYPLGTTLWKEFVRDGVRVETRILKKMTSRRWAMVAYQWHEDQKDAEAVVEGVPNASGTEHDIPSEEQCWDCHNRMPDASLGFIAVQLAHEGGSEAGSVPQWTVAQLEAEGMLTTPVPVALPVPGTEVEQAALGYLQGNCAHCHHPQTTLSRVADLSFQLDVTTLSGEATDTPAYLTTVGVPSQLEEGPAGVEYRIDPAGSHENSMVLVRYLQRGTEHSMPPLGTEIVDPAGTQALEAWITYLGTR